MANAKEAFFSPPQIITRRQWFVHQWKKPTAFRAKCILFPLGASRSQPSSLWAAEHFERLGGKFHLHLLQAATPSSGTKLQCGTKIIVVALKKRTQIKQIKYCLPLWGWLKNILLNILWTIINSEDPPWKRRAAGASCETRCLPALRLSSRLQPWQRGRRLATDSAEAVRVQLIKVMGGEEKHHIENRWRDDRWRRGELTGREVITLRVECIPQRHRREKVTDTKQWVRGGKKKVCAWMVKGRIGGGEPAVEVISSKRNELWTGDGRCYNFHSSCVWTRFRVNCQ